MIEIMATKCVISHTKTFALGKHNHSKKQKTCLLSLLHLHPMHSPFLLPFLDGCFKGATGKGFPYPDKCGIEIL